jgi:flagellar assembly protein FliH
VSAPFPSDEGEWAGGLALLVRRPGIGTRAPAAALRFGGELPIADFDAPPPAPAPAVAASAPAPAADEAEIAERLQSARLQAARDEGYAEGLEAGLRQAEADRAARDSTTLAAVAAALENGRDAAREAAGEAARDVAGLLLAALDAALPAAAARLAPEGAAILAATLEPLLRDGVAVTLFVASGEAEAAAARIGDRPGLAVEEDAALAPGDARASWRGGTAKASLAARRAAVAEILDALGLQEA